MPGTQVRDSESPRHISPYCPQNSVNTDWFCPGGSVCSIPLWKVSLFFGPHFSCEQDGQPNFKFDIDSEVLSIYRLIPRKTNFLGCLTIFDTTPICRFWGLLVAFRAAYNVKVLVYGYQSINLRFIVVPVKFDGGLFISDREKSNSLPKKVKSLHFQKHFKRRHLKKGRTFPHEKYRLLLDMHFLVKEVYIPTSNFRQRKVCYISIEICKVCCGFSHGSLSVRYSKQSLFGILVRYYRRHATWNHFIVSMVLYIGIFMRLMWKLK
jgi:hypothetical protein